MKTLFVVMLILNLLLGGARSFFEYGLHLEPTLLEDKAQLLISNKASSEQNSAAQSLWTFKDFTDLLTTQQLDIIYHVVSYDSGTFEKVYYSTTWNQDFLHITAVNSNQPLNKNDFLTTSTHAPNARQLKGISFDSVVSIYSMDTLSKTPWSNGAYYVRQKDVPQVKKILTEQGFEAVEIATTPSTENSILIFLPAIQMGLLVFGGISGIFLAISRRKQFALLKINGYSNLQIMQKIILPYCLLVFILAALVYFGFALVVNFLSPGSGLDFLIFSYKSLLLAIGYCVGLLLLSSLYVICTVSYRTIRGKTHALDLYFFCLGMKWIALIAILFALITGINMLPFIFQNQQGLKAIQNTMKDYYFFEFTDAEDQIPSNIDSVSGQCTKFIKLTEDSFAGILADAGSFVSGPGHLSGYAITNEKIFEINKNYLELNPIYDADGKRILKKDIPDNKLVALIVEGSDENRFIDQIKIQYQWTSDQVKDKLKIIYYSKQSEIYAYQEGIPNIGLLPEPQIIIYSEVETNFHALALNNISGGTYFVRIESENPYQTLLPYIKEAGLEKNLLTIQPVSQAFQDEINLNTRILQGMMALIILASTLFAFLAIYEVFIYFLVYRQRITLKKIFGFGFLHIYSGPILIRIFISLSLIVVAPFMAVQFSPSNMMIFILCVVLPLTLTLLDFLVFFLLWRRAERIQVAQVVRGDIL